ncbi:MAG: hypothetical protein ABIJ56_12050 [Pseudomonadota bacterium]
MARLFCAFYAILLLVISGCSGRAVNADGPHEDEVKKLYSEAVRFVELARKAESKSYAESSKYYKSALEQLDKLISKYPQSLLSMKIMQGEAWVGIYTRQQLEEEVVPGSELKAEAEKSPLACCFLVAQSIEDSYSKACILGNLAAEYELMKEEDRAAEILEQALKSAELISSSNRWTGEYNSSQFAALAEIAHSFAAAGLFDRALEISGSIMNDAGRADAMDRIAMAYLRAGQHEEALKLSGAIDHEAMKKLTNSDIREPVPVLVIRSYMANGDMVEALHVAEEIKDIRLKADAKAEIISEYLKLGQEGKAEELAIGLDEDSTSTACQKVSMLVEVAMKYAGSGKGAKAGEMLSAALEITGNIDPPSWKADALSEIALGYAEAGQFKKALKTAQSIGKASKYTRIATTVKIAGSYAGIGNKDELLNMLLKAVEETQIIEDTSYKSELLVHIVRAYASAGKYDEALQLTQVVEDDFWKARALTGLAIESGKAGEKVKAQNNLSHALHLAQKEKDVVISAQIMENIAKEFAEAGMLKNALDIIKDMEIDNYRDKVMLSIAGYYIQSGQFDRGFDLLKEIQTDENFMPMNVMMADLVKSYIGSGQLEKGLNAAVSVKDTAMKTTALIEVAAAYGKSSDKHKCAEVLTLALTGTIGIADNVMLAEALLKSSRVFLESWLKVDENVRKILHTIVNKQQQ